MALNLSPGHVLCPPCAGTGRKTIVGGDYRTADHGACPMCGGSGEVTTERLEAFWACTLVRTFGIPWTCAQEDSWL